MRSLGRQIALAAVLGSAATVSGCSSPEGSSERGARTAHSWSGTVRTTSKALAAGAVPRHYARQVLEAATDGRRQLSQQPEWLSLPQNTRAQLEDAIRELASSLGTRADSAARQ